MLKKIILLAMGIALTQLNALTSPPLTRWEQLKAHASEFAASTKTKAEAAVQTATQKIMSLGEKMGISKKRVAALIVGAALASGGIYIDKELKTRRAKAVQAHLTEQAKQSNQPANYPGALKRLENKLYAFNFNEGRKSLNSQDYQAIANNAAENRKIIENRLHQYGAESYFSKTIHLKSAYSDKTYSLTDNTDDFRNFRKLSNYFKEYLDSKI